jgi:hypothetical protein
VSVYVYHPAGRLRRWWGTLRDIPLLLADRIGDDQEPRWLRALMLLILLLFVVAMVLWCAAWATR